MQAIKEKMAYSAPAKQVAKLLQRFVYKQSRVHWICDAFAGHKTFASLPR